MDNVFDSFKAQTFSSIATTMGYTAICEGVEARVLYNEPSVSEKLSEHSFEYSRPTLEFKTGDWVGVREKIEAKDDVLISVKGKEYYAMKIVGDGTIAKDGETYKIALQEV